jgi:hypothetical protein
MEMSEVKSSQVENQDEVLEFQVKVPVCVTLYLKRDDAEWMTKEDLAGVVTAVLEAESTLEDKDLSVVTDSGTVAIKYSVNPSWDNLPPDECELVYEDEEGFFPMAD